MNRPTISIVLALSFWACMGTRVTAQDKAAATAKDTVSELMRTKLDSAKNALEGITVGKLEMVTKSAAQMSALSLNALWRVYQTPEYVRLSTEFRLACNEMEQAAKRKDLDRATLSYMKITLKCVECHKHVRTVRVAKSDRSRGAGAHDSLAIAQPIRLLDLTRVGDPPD